MAVDADVLLDWFSARGRDLPWREPTCSAWGVLVSEIMLQQTPVVRVQPIWHEWMARWPVPSALAASSQGEVVRAWGKLGYPRRALRLHEAAGVIAREHGDVVPSDVDTLLALPGIGAYTARAVAAFAYGRRAPVVDTNVRRVVARAVHGAGDAGPASNTRDMADVEALLPAKDAPAAKFSAAIMELGALICTARSPKCADCPIYDECAWQHAGRPEYAGPAKPVQKFAGTDRQVRGRLLDVLRGSEGPVEKARLDLVWHDSGQRDRCLDSLLVDGLLEQTRDGLFALPGEH
ncbi:A/G-specific adenine glycosylase [Amycolatopsis balhimycina DSM 5908]|uniref:Adenine DNA glycosylase n=1 Tax=Amycolatopsis balhimycina DSM 5908 TaxID=1081091 RepID=A0A428WEX3_AMYBA|nr:A/G-specific adenine glycosylase [Amycolatopsis balhimycina]RSM41629.1 A/G-specific adenine glycosylase [Amycolatopsis balhimycina DSM 5908]